MKRIVSLAAVGSNDSRPNHAMPLPKGVLAMAFAVVAVCVVFAAAVTADAQARAGRVGAGGHREHPAR